MLTESQLIERKKGIGGSDAAAICGVSRWKTPIDVYIDKTSQEINNNEENRYTYWGNVLEPIIVKQYEKETGKNVDNYKSTFVSKNNDFMRANIDGWISKDRAVLECKTATASSSHMWGESGSDFFPDEYLIQCAHYAIVCNAEYVDLAVLIGGNDFRIYKYNRNEALELLILHAEEEFWNNNVLKGIPPYPRTENDLNKILKSTKGQMKYAPESCQNILNIIKETDEKIKELEKKRDDLSFVIKQTISDFDGLIDDIGNTLCTWKFQESNRFDIKRFKKENPDIYDKFINKSSSRVLRIRR
ncbi:MAG: YqaJ viral recombinase family protein [Candidatus Nitrosocosmicus sp.]